MMAKVKTPLAGGRCSFALQARGLPEKGGCAKAHRNVDDIGGKAGKFRK